MTPLETLKAARDLISDPARWTQGAYAKNANGKSVLAWDGHATCFCALGAIQHFVEAHDTYVEDVLDDACNTHFQVSVMDFNDTHTHAEVIALFDAAIAELEGA